MIRPDNDRATAAGVTLKLNDITELVAGLANASLPEERIERRKNGILFGKYGELLRRDQDELQTEKLLDE